MAGLGGAVQARATVRHFRLFLRPTLSVPICYLLLALVVYRSTLTHLGDRLPGGSDGLLFSWYLAWFRDSVIHWHNPFFSMAINAPYGVNTMWNTSVLTLAVATLPISLLIGPFVTTGLLFVLAPALSATSAFLVLRRLTRVDSGAVVGGLMFGFGPFFVGHFGHLNLIFVPLLPVLAGLGYRLVVEWRGSGVRAAVLFGVCFGLQMLISEEIAVLVVVAGICALVAFAVVQWRVVRRQLPALVRRLGVAVLAALVVCGVPLAFQLWGLQALTGGTAHGSQRADLISLVRGSVLQRFGSTAGRSANVRPTTANGAENTAFLGWPLVIFLLVVVGWHAVRGRSFARWWLLSAGLLLALSLGAPIDAAGRPVGEGPWWLLSKLPFVSGAQPVRFSLLTTFLLAVLISWLLGRYRGAGRSLVLLACALVLVPWWPRTPYTSDPTPATPQFFSSSAVRVLPRGVTVLILPVAIYPHAAPMVWQIKSGMRFNMIGGYSVFNRDGNSVYFPQIAPPIRQLAMAVLTGDARVANAANVRAALRASGVSDVIITNYVPNPRRAVEVVRQLTECTPLQISDVTVCALPTPGEAR